MPLALALALAIFCDADKAPTILLEGLSNEGILEAIATSGADVSMVLAALPPGAFDLAAEAEVSWFTGFWGQPNRCSPLPEADVRSELFLTSASDCGFNWSAQHLDSAKAEKDVAYDLSNTDSVHRSR